MIEGVPGEPVARPSRDEAEEAIRTLIRWAGDDPQREGLRETPARLARALRSTTPATPRIPWTC